MASTTVLTPSIVISQEEYNWQRNVYTRLEVEKLQKTDAFQNFVSDPTKKIPLPTRPRIPLTSLFLLIPFLTVFYYLQQHDEHEVVGTAKWPKATKIWAKPASRHGLAYEKLEVKVPAMPLAVQIVPVSLMCGLIDHPWVIGFGNQTSLWVPLPEAGTAKICLKNTLNNKIIDVANSEITVCGVTTIKAPDTRAGRPFNLYVEGVCLEGRPLLSIVPMGKSLCESGRFISGHQDLRGWSFNLSISIGSVPLTCVKSREGWIRLPRLVIFGATAYTSSTPKLRSTMEISVSGLDMDPNPQLVLVTEESSCQSVKLTKSPTEIRLISATPALAKWIVNLRNLSDPLHPTPLTAGMKMMVCIGWKGQYSQVGEPLTLENDTSTFATGLALSFLAVVMYMLFSRREEVKKVTDSPNTCSICWTNSTNVAFNCGHVCTCSTCSPRCHLCPICRTVIKKKLKVFFS